MLEQVKSCCFTGYRPEKFPFHLCKKNRKYNILINQLVNTVSNLIENGCTVFYTGMAKGFDIISAEAVLKLKKKYKFDNIKLICAIPFLDQSLYYEKDWLKRYRKIIASADKVILLSDKYNPKCYAKRNNYMVDNSHYIVTWFDGRSGGTKNTLDYGNKKLKKIININNA